MDMSKGSSSEEKGYQMPKIPDIAIEATSTIAGAGAAYQAGTCQQATPLEIS